MFYTIFKAITNYQCGPNLTSADYTQNYIYMTVSSFGSLYGISIYQTHVDVELLKKFECTYIPSIYPITNPFHLSVIFSLLKVCRRELYDRLFSRTENELDITYLRNNLEKMTREELGGSDIYLAIFALLGVPTEGGVLNIGGKEVTLRYEINELELMPFGVDWAYMGRGLWQKMCKWCEMVREQQ